MVDYLSLALGALLAVAVFMALRIRRMARNTLETIANAPLPAMGDHAKITVWGFTDKPINNAFDLSPFVARVEAFLRLHRIAYIKMETTKGGFENPRGKLPFANVRGVMMDDSDRIIDLIRLKCIDEPDALTPQQRALAFFLSNTLKHAFYWVQLYDTFATDAGAQRFKAMMQHKSGTVLGAIIALFACSAQRDNLWGSGIGRLPHAQIVELGRNTLRALTDALGDKPYFLGDAPSDIDADAYAFLAPLFYRGAAWAPAAPTQYRVLATYVDRMRDLLQQRWEEAQ